jgi:hypothetical protein
MPPKAPRPEAEVSAAANREDDTADASGVSAAAVDAAIAAKAEFLQSAFGRALLAQCAANADDAMTWALLRARGANDEDVAAFIAAESAAAAAAATTATTNTTTTTNTSTTTTTPATNSAPLPAPAPQSAAQRVRQQQQQQQPQQQQQAPQQATQQPIPPTARGAWAAGRPTNMAAMPTVELADVPKNVRRAFAEANPTAPADYRRPPKDVASFDPGAIYAFALKQDYDDANAATLHEDGFKMGVFLRAFHTVVVRVPGSRSWAFSWGLQTTVREGRVSTRVSALLAPARRTIEIDGLPEELVDDRVVLQGTPANLAKWATDVVPCARIGQMRAGGDEVIEALGKLKDGGVNHLLSATRGDVCVGAGHRGATVKLPFGESTFEGRYNIAGMLARQFGATALVRGFDVRMFLPRAWTAKDIEEVKALRQSGKPVVKTIFTDVPLVGASDVGGTASEPSVKEAALAHPCGLVVTATSPMTREMWQAVCVKLKVTPLLFSVAFAAVAAPNAAAAADLDDVAVGRRFRVSRPARSGGA